MICDEETARGKWCPMARTAESMNRDAKGLIHDEDECIASACIMWRYSTQWVKAKGLPAEEIEDKTKGYCGLAGG